MKRIYKEFSYGKELSGYEYEGEMIEIEHEFIGTNGNTKKWYRCNKLKKLGYPSCFDTLKECMMYIQKMKAEDLYISKVCGGC